MRRAVIAMATLLWATWLTPILRADDSPQMIIVIGAPGESAYAGAFATWASRVEQAAARAKWLAAVIGRDDDAATPDRERLQQLLNDSPRDAAEPLWLVLIGHGTYDGRSAKFNLRGPDVAAAELGEWLKEAGRPIVIINCASSSGPFLATLSGPDRVIITATKSGYEHNATRLAEYLSRTLADPQADLDKDEQTSLLEAFLFASRAVEDSYKLEDRLATEHALIDDNGDGLGTPASFFRGVRAERKAQGGKTTDGLRAHQIHLLPSERERHMPAELRERRDALERQLNALREQKAQIQEDAYYARIEPIMLELARVYEASEVTKGQ